MLSLVAGIPHEELLRLIESTIEALREAGKSSARAIKCTEIATVLRESETPAPPRAATGRGDLRSSIPPSPSSRPLARMLQILALTPHATAARRISDRAAVRPVSELWDKTWRRRGAAGRPRPALPEITFTPPTN